MVLHDLICPSCDTLFPDELVDVDMIRSGQWRHTLHAEVPLEICYLPRRFSAPACHPSETCVVYYSPTENKIQYPARNDLPVPDRLQRRGYQKQEMRSLKEIERFEKQHKVLNERVWFDKGSGRGLEDGHK